MASILQEVQQLADTGCRELTLLGQNVNSYADRSSDAEGASEDGFGGYAQVCGVLSRMHAVERCGARGCDC